MDRLRALLHQLKVVVGAWIAVRAEAQDLTEHETRESRSVGPAVG